jgi:hypothetical protein
MDNIVRTVYGSYLQSCQLLGLPFALATNSTLNEKFQVQPGVLPNSGVLPTCRYFAIGNGGHKLNITNGLYIPEPIQHLTTDAALYNHLPFVLREPTNDLTSAQQAAYGLRVAETHNGVNYIAYYLKRIDFTGVAVSMQYKTINADGSVTTTPFQPDTSNLNPNPQALSPTGVNVATGDYVMASAPVPITLTADDVTEILNVANIIYGDPNAAIVSEIALVSGVDKVIAVGGSGQPTFNFKEVIAAQVDTFINTFYALNFSQDGVENVVDCGAVEPLYKLTSGTGTTTGSQTTTS